LFKDILKCTGRKSIDGKSKGGIKAHTVINADEKVPEMIWLTSGVTNDQKFLNKLKCDSNTIYVFDKGYNDYKMFKLFSEKQTGFVTRLKDNAKFESKEENIISDKLHSGVLLDTIIEVEVKENDVTSKLKLRKVRFYDRANKRVFEFVTNLFDFRADTIAALYKIRWQIELVFKQLKQNFPLKYFLGDNENAIKIQIFCALIVNLLIEVIRKTLKRKWSFSNLVSFCRIHLFNYIHIVKFLESSEKEWKNNKEYYMQFGLFDKDSGEEIFSSA
jgi:IS4 transposase